MDNPSKIKKAFAEMAKGIDALALAHMKPAKGEAESIRTALEIKGHKQVMEQLIKLVDVFQGITNKYEAQFSDTFVEVPGDSIEREHGGWGVFVSDPQKTEELRQWAYDNLTPLISLLAEGVSPFFSEPVTGEIYLMEMLFGYFEKEGYERTLLPLINVDYAEPPLFRKLRENNRSLEGYEGHIDIEEVMGLYLPKQEQVTLFHEGIRWCSARHDMHEGWLRAVILIHELAHWMIHRLPKTNIPVFETDSYIKTPANFHECVAQLLTWWVAKKAPPMFKKTFMQLNEHQSPTYKSFSHFASTKPKIVIAALDKIRFDGKVTSLVEFEKIINENP